MGHPLITVLLPIYNVRQYLDRCIKSVVNQSYANLEIIMVDDGSTDGSHSLCDEWAVKNSRIPVSGSYLAFSFERQRRSGYCFARHFCTFRQRSSAQNFLPPHNLLVCEVFKVEDNDKNNGKNPDTVLCLEDSNFWNVVFSDIIQLDNVVMTSPHMRWKGMKALAKKICKIHHSFRLNSVIEMPFKGIWNRYDYVYNLEDSIKRWIFTDTSVRGYDRTSINWLKAKGIRLHILFLNPVISSYETAYAMRLVREGYFELVYTVDSGDASKYGFLYTSSVYSKKEIVPDNNRWKISYVGTAKNRISELHSMADILQGTKSIFYISGVHKNDRKALSNVVYNHLMSYDDILKIVAKSDCILEVLQSGQIGFTFRTYEALCYNKKLLTNNQDIRNQTFYDPKFIKVFTEIDSSLLEFISNEEMPDYNYKGEYSPVKLYRDMLLREKNDSVK